MRGLAWAAGALWLAGLPLGPQPALAAAEPAPFVPLESIAPRIVQEIRYAGPFNFTAAPLPGYRAARCWLLPEAAHALAAVDARLARFGLGLKVWDCYRPVRASRAMVRWAASRGPVTATERYFLGPMSRAAVLSGAFVAPRSRHNRGTTVDLTVVPRGHGPRPLDQAPGARTTCTADDAAVPFGTTHDCFASASVTRSTEVSPAARAARGLLAAEMERAGFVNYAKEWWHFTLASVPAAGRRAWDVDVR